MLGGQNSKMCIGLSHTIVTEGWTSLSSSYSVKDTNRGKDRIARTRIQDWRKAGICVGVEETSSECKEPAGHHEGSKPLLNWREPCKKTSSRRIRHQVRESGYCHSALSLGREDTAPQADCVPWGGCWRVQHIDYQACDRPC